MIFMYFIYYNENMNFKKYLMLKSELFKLKRENSIQLWVSLKIFSFFFILQLYGNVNIVMRIILYVSFLLRKFDFLLNLMDN